MQTFDKPIRPSLLLQALELDADLRKLPIERLLSTYKVTMFTACLARYPSIRYYSWDTYHEQKLLKLSSGIKIGELLSELNRRNAIEVANSSFAISQLRITNWIRNERRAANV